MGRGDLPLKVLRPSVAVPLWCDEATSTGDFGPLYAAQGLVQVPDRVCGRTQVSPTHISRANPVTSPHPPCGGPEG